MANKATRRIGLDILRAIAVILVLIRHSNLSDSMIFDFSWLGVDLFFVLSGFLISSLLFEEYQQKESISIKRFLIRRGLKIFPPFYFFMLSTIAVGYLYGTRFEWSEVLAELFYLQSYAPNVWLHTWTLAVEEHFYLAFSIVMLILSRKNLIPNTKYFIGTLVFLVVFCFLMRLETSYPHRHEASYSFMKTHLRADGIVIGVLLSYLYHFTTYTNILLKNKWLTFLVSIILICPGFYFKGGSFFMNTVGLTTVNLGFALWVFLSLDIEKHIDSLPLKLFKYPCLILSFIGINSYSVYLWHLNSKEIVYHFFSYNENVMMPLYIFVSITLGIFMSYLIEKSFLKLRDKLF